MNIKKARKERGITQQELAERIGVNRATVSKYESGQISIPFAQVLAIAEALDIALYELLLEFPEHHRDIMLASFEAGYSKYGTPDNIPTKQSTFDFFFYDLNHKENRIFNDLAADYHKLNIDGMKEAARCVKIIAGNPIFQRASTLEPHSNDD